MLGEPDQNIEIKEENVSSYEEELKANGKIYIQENRVFSKEDNSEIHQQVLIKEEELSDDEDRNVSALCDVDCDIESSNVNGNPTDIEHPADANAGLPLAVFIKEEHEVDKGDQHCDGVSTEEMFSNRANYEEPFGNHFLSKKVSAPTKQRVRQRYTQENVRKALDAIKNKGATISAASRDFCIPKSTLHDKVTGRRMEVGPMGRPSVLTKEEEDSIVQWALNIAKAGFSITRDQLIDSVSHLVKDLNRPNPFKDNVPGETWYYLFSGRHPIISQHVSQGLTSCRAQFTGEQLGEWFLKVKTYLQEKGLLHVFNDPRRVFSVDESAFHLSPNDKQVLTRKNEKTSMRNDQQTENDDKECITVLLNANVAGELAPPMVVFDYERIPAGITRKFPGEWGLGKSKSGWMTRETFYQYVTKVFQPWLSSANITFPVLLFIDRHTSHLSKYLTDYCTANGIEIVALYPNSTQILQPLDVAVFKPLKMAWKKSVDQWGLANNGRRIEKEEFSPILQNVLQKLDSKEIIRGFKATGLDKLNPDSIHYSLIMEKHIHYSGIYSLEKKLGEIRSHLCLLETKIGPEKMQRFAVNEVPTSDESLYDVWKSIKREVISLEEEIAFVKQHLIPTDESENVPQTTNTNTMLKTTYSTDDPDEDEGEKEDERYNKKEEGQVLAVGNDPLNGMKVGCNP